jgi:hypothetical protein
LVRCHDSIRLAASNVSERRPDWAERFLRRLLIIGANSVVIKRNVHKEAQPGT